ncbi:LuxR C-terminal-related transcriptional regulator [Halomonas sp. AOP43-D1-4]|uniref:LuxR C-terminal-related transcriptional regulator n=1 Tax=Halomonas sp. AOP43-D1-4 TaxID=3457658 RepID=UPI004034ED42
MQITTEPQEFECQGFKCRFGPRNSEWPTRVQAQVIACIAAGLTHKEIAKVRGCSPRTISATSSAILYYLNAHRAAGAVAEAMRRGWIAPVVLALLISGINPDAEGMRHRAPARTQTRVSTSRTVSRRDVGSVYA